METMKKPINAGLIGLRAVYKIRQVDLMEVLDISRATYLKKEQGAYPFTLPEACKLLAYFKQYDPELTFENVFKDQFEVAKQQIN